jgi:8-oxo-dGTP pyrophosphatase MutT (NUDIX family)
MCLIRRKKSKVWGIPKGVVDAGDTRRETALNEAWEEAGLSGKLLDKAVGTYEYEKWGTTLTVAVYLMQVVKQEATWDEDTFRERHWTSFDDGAALLKRHPVYPLLGRALRLIEKAEI